MSYWAVIKGYVDPSDSVIAICRHKDEAQKLLEMLWRHWGLIFLPRGLNIMELTCWNCCAERTPKMRRRSK